MSVGLLIICHNQVGQALLDASCTVLDSCPLRTQIISITNDQNIDDVHTQIEQKLDKLDTGDGVLVLTDMYGATPSNIICAFDNRHIAIVSGLNMPMLIRVMNYPGLNLEDLMSKAVSGGTEGIMHFYPGKEDYATRRN